MRKLLFAITSFLMLLTGCNGLSEDRTETNETDSRQVMTDKGNISRSVIEILLREFNDTTQYDYW